MAANEILIGLFQLEHRIERAHRALRNIGDVLHAQLSHFFGAQCCDVYFFIPVDTVINLAANQAQRRHEVVEKRFQQRGLAATAFARDAVDFVFINRQAHIVNGFDDLLRAMHLQEIESFELFGS